MSDYIPQETPFVKQLAASDRPTRDKAVASLRTYLGARRKFIKADLLKLWRGLFYCMWLSDRPRRQQALANDLSELLTCITGENATLFLRAFWETIAQEWSNIDVLRVDKFMLLVRCQQAASFRILQSYKWDEGLTHEFMQILEDIPLNPTNRKITNGLRFHVMDIYLDELGGLGPEATNSTLPLDVLLRPIRKLSIKGLTKIVRKRAKEALADERLVLWGYNSHTLIAQSNLSVTDVDEEWAGIES